MRVWKSLCVSALVLFAAAGCVVSLDGSSLGAFTVSNRDYTVNGCSVHVNSTDPEAIDGNPNGLIDQAHRAVAGEFVVSTVGIDKSRIDTDATLSVDTGRNITVGKRRRSPQKTYLFIDDTVAHRDMTAGNI